MYTFFFDSPGICAHGDTVGGGVGGFAPKLASEIYVRPQILSHKILVTSTTNFTFEFQILSCIDLHQFSFIIDISARCKIMILISPGILPQFLPLVLADLPTFLLLFGHIAPNYVFKLESRSEPP